MMKVYQLLSSNSKYPLAEIRTDGKVVDFYVDNTDGQLTKRIQTLAQLKQYVRRSSILKLVEAKEATANLLRYVMDNGDVVEITTDGKTAILNNRMLTEEEKQSLFEAIKRKEINVARKADSSKPVPVFPTQSAQGGDIQEVKSSGISEPMMEEIKHQQSQLKKTRSMSTKSYDYEIEGGDYSGSEDPAYTKKMLYTLKYGDSNE